MTTYELYDGKPPHERGSETSRDAAVSMIEASDSLRSRVYRVLVSRGEKGATDDQLERTLHVETGRRQRHQTISARRRELVLLGLVRDSGQTRLTSSAREATVWVVAPAADFCELEWQKIRAHQRGESRRHKLGRWLAFLNAGEWPAEFGGPRPIDVTDAQIVGARAALRAVLAVLR